MKIKVFNEEDIQIYKPTEKHIVISVQDPMSLFVTLPENPNRLDCLGLHFYDLDEDIGQFPYSRYIFTINNADAILNFVADYKNVVDLILVNCVAGISRSAGIAAALSKIYNGDDSFYFKKYLPNMLVYRTILQQWEERNK